jgi:hypothetical protein
MYAADQIITCLVPRGRACGGSCPHELRVDQLSQVTPDSAAISM